MAGSIDIKDTERLAKEVTGIGSSSTSVSEDGVGGSLSMMFTQIFLSSALLKRLSLTTKYIKSKFYFSLYSWLFSTNSLPFTQISCSKIKMAQNLLFKK